MKWKAFINRYARIVLIVSFALAAACATKPKIPVTGKSVEPGNTVTFKGERHRLLGNPISVGDSLGSVSLVDSMTLKEVDPSTMRGSVLFLSVVPSVDTKVCEAQTHYLGEEGDKLPESVRRITISRDTPFAHQRFAEEADLTDLRYLSDYREAAFGRATGLLVEGLMLLARAVILVDKEGIVRYMQVVPEITHLPDMESAFNTALQLDTE
jgi:thiol peroxidase